MKNGRAIIEIETTNESGGVYLVDRSEDGFRFKTIGKIECKDGKYIFCDKRPIVGISYYRVRYQDIKGNSWISTLIPIKNIK